MTAEKSTKKELIGPNVLNTPITMPDGDATGCPFHLIELARRQDRLELHPPEAKFNEKRVLVEHPAVTGLDHIEDGTRFVQLRDGGYALVAAKA